MKIQFKGVAKQFGDVVAVKDLDFTIKKGDFIFLTGPSGAGKTPILRLISGYYLPSEGEVTIDGKSLAAMSKKDLLEWRRKVGMVFQEFKLISRMTVAENIDIAFALRRVPRKKRAGLLEEVLKTVGLTSKENAFPAQLSGGELQRVCLARALAMRPKILLADEPTGNLDPVSSWKLMELLQEISQKGRTVIMATHNADIVNSLRSRVIALKKGRVVSDQQGGRYQ